jgi:microfibrillar-associated protein 1
MTANPVKAPRYRPGKAIAEENSSSESEGSDAEAEAVPQPPSKPPPKFTSAGGISSNLSKVDLNERRKKAAANEAARIAEEQTRRAKEEEEFVTEESEEGSEEDSKEESEDDEEEESEEEAPRRVMMRPMFIKKDKRKELGVAVADVPPEAEQLAEKDARRKAAADEIVEEQIQKDLAAKAAGKKYWGDDEDEGNDVDDTDDLDPEAELAAWKLRELKRIKRDREAIEEREREREEIERRKNLTEEERKAEDDAFLAKQKEDKEGKGKMSYMQKYYHKGAFFQDDLKAEGLDRRDIMGSRFADDVQNRELLPQALQMRDMTKLGKKGATKYKDLKNEDTGRWGQFDARKPRQGQGDFVADERFMPDRGGGGSGANSQPVAERKRPDRVVGAPEAPRAMRVAEDRPRDGDTYRPKDGRSERRSRSRSRSRSPRRDRYYDDRIRRKRSSSRDRDCYDSDKRRRVDS